MVSLGDRLVSTYSNRHCGGGGASSYLDSGKKIGVWKLGGGVFWKRSDLDSGKKIAVWKFGEGCVLEKVGFGLGEENWSLEMGGGGLGGFWKRYDLDSGKKIGIWKFGGGGVVLK